MSSGRTYTAGIRASPGRPLSLAAASSAARESTMAASASSLAATLASLTHRIDALQAGARRYAYPAASGATSAAMLLEDLARATAPAGAPRLIQRDDALLDRFRDSQRLTHSLRAGSGPHTGSLSRGASAIATPGDSPLALQDIAASGEPVLRGELAELRKQKAQLLAEMAGVRRERDEARTEAQAREIELTQLRLDAVAEKNRLLAKLQAAADRTAELEAKNGALEALVQKQQDMIGRHGADYAAHVQRLEDDLAAARTALETPDHPLGKDPSLDDILAHLEGHTSSDDEAAPEPEQQLEQQTELQPEQQPEHQPEHQLHPESDDGSSEYVYVYDGESDDGEQPELVALVARTLAPISAEYRNHVPEHIIQSVLMAFGESVDDANSLASEVAGLAFDDFVVLVSDMVAHAAVIGNVTVDSAIAHVAHVVADM
ncbi:uncharacterized protein AMSG_07738 [Thecamonas trahens ATCC 50062]|uniref:Uncharacterized protein n=1 Tax=Thecamonas trahens ATCC 50062 TaxID=461836 RepID=A0A0L0DHI4_THETB|nr:hypothetical protein AMSG_07738 [Thecamonas trahens ATCC 50062]KNC51675.1 hypothetical protein AMSG_07738 [Thecamonas trahens ATCC 50062]|eukprot:XP_013755810.1 hypothetical protein AMSG_07738 [Thecamonas trahens ATCC 50062]